MSTHMFSVEFATEFWIEKACIIQNLYFWIEKNIKNKKHFYELDWEIRCWTYNSASAFSELLPYISSRSISRHLKELADEWIIFINNFNKIKYDKTLWYSINYDNKAISEVLQIKKPILGAICQNGESIGENGEPIPDSKPDTSTSAIATVDVAQSQIKKRKRINHKGSSSIRERTLSEPFVPPEKEVFIELLWDTNWVSKYYEFFSIWKIYQSFTHEQLKELYLWMIDFFKEKSNWKIYRDEDWHMVWSKIILNELDKMIAHYSSKWNDIIDLKATLRWWITRNSEPYPFTKK